MANQLGTKLNRLIRQRAYAAGELTKLAAAEATAKLAANEALRQVRAARKGQKALTATLAELDHEIVALSVIDTHDIRSIRGTPRLGPFKHGEFSTQLVEFMKAAQRDMDTREIVAAMVDHFGLPFETPEDHEASRRRVVERLRVLARKGAIKRLHDTGTSFEGRWRWVGL